MKEIFDRVSVRKYTVQPVEAEKVEKLLRAAMAAPSAGNQQPWEFCVVRNRETLDQLAACSPYAKPLLGAPLGIVILSREEGLRFPEYWEQDLGACTQNLLLEAEHLGLGAVCKGLKPFALVAVGYPDPAFKQPKHDRYDPARVRYVD